VRALTIDGHGGLEQVRFRDDLPVPALTHSRHVRVKLHAAALNHLDLFTIQGMPHLRITFPWIIGADGAGVVDEAGDEVSTLRPGDAVFLNPGQSCGRCEYCRAGDQPLCLEFRILGEHLPGTLAEYVVVPERSVRAIPPTTPMQAAAAYPLATLTAWRMCVTRARIQAGENVLIHGIGGGVAVAALLIAKSLGARVWVTSRSDAKLERARSLGADETILAGPRIDVGREIRARTGKRGVDVVVENVGAATWAQSLGALGRRGRLVTCGATSGPLVETDLRRLFWNQWSILGSTMGSDEEFDAITREFTAGRLSAVVDSVFPLEQGRQALDRLQQGEQFGKVVLAIV
jgi:NADPH:quinone reductase-like Zn-dependent oxidoreductase